MRIKRALHAVYKDFRKNRVLVIMLLPAIVYFIVFAHLPMVGSIVAFKQYDYAGGIFGSKWVGWSNFTFFFSGDFFTSAAWKVTRNTVLYNTAFIVVNNLLQISLAIFLTEINRRVFKRVSQTLMLLPYFISWVVVSAFIYNLFNYENGVLNGLLKMVGLPPIDVLSTVAVWKYIIVFFAAWSAVGYWTIIYMAAIMSIDKGMYEAAEIDGANIFQRIFHITLPSLKPTIIILLLISIGGLFRGNLSMFYQIVGKNGLLYDSTDVIDTYVFRMLLTSPEFGRTAAVGLYQSVLCFAILLIANGLIRKYDKDYALF